MFAKVLWSGNLNKEFWLSSRCCENAFVIGCSMPSPTHPKRGGGGGERKRKKERPVTLFAEAC